ncbi:hypothetical protein ACFRAQ_03540 [Nocardia sp. NPDC056611]|uniref:hypothetical protein n=1 Tax=Nocardia sp. NPDC056611 TaxID=3345877 RepID=UPI00366F0F60
MTYATARIAVGAAATIALGAGTLLGSATAGAAPSTITWDDGTSHYTRTVSNTTPAVGETITVSTKFEQKGSTDETIDYVADYRPSCLTYVAKSAKMTDNSGDHAVENNLMVDDEVISADFTATSFKMVVKHGGAQSPTFSAQYKVGADCSKQTGALETGFNYLSSLGYHTFDTKGPSITISKTPGTGNTGSADGVLAGLSSLLGGFGSSK